MVMSMFGADSQRRPRALRPRAPRPTQGVSPYRLDVIGGDVADVVESIGGWLFDLVMAGWRVNVLVEAGDPAPLRILGALPTPMSSVAAMRGRDPVAVSADLLTSNSEVRASIMARLDRGLTDVTTWGRENPSNLQFQCATVEHRLSAAALVFKAQALVAAQLHAGPSKPVERLRARVGGTMAAELGVQPRPNIPAQLGVNSGGRPTMTSRHLSGVPTPLSD